MKHVYKLSFKKNETKLFVKKKHFKTQHKKVFAIIPWYKINQPSLNFYSNSHIECFAYCGSIPYR